MQCCYAFDTPPASTIEDTMLDISKLTRIYDPDTIQTNKSAN